MSSYKRKNYSDKSVDDMPTPLKKVCQQIGTPEDVHITFDDLAGCDTVLLVYYTFEKNLIKN